MPGDDGVRMGGCSDVPRPLTGGAACGACAIRSNLVTMRQTEPAWGPLVLDRGF